MKVFKEEQRFTQTWLLVLLIVSTIVSLLVVIKEYNNGKISTSKLLFTIGIILVSVGLIFLFKLSTRIDENGIYYKFFPFHLKFKVIKWSEINNTEVRKYDAIYEYGGWGFKGGALWNKSRGKAINVSGNIGIQIMFKNGKKLLIGTQKKTEAKQVLETYKNKLIK